MNAYESHPLLLRAARGTPEYTAQLRILFEEIRREPLTPTAADEWMQLRDAHLALLGPDRAAHALLLRPRLLIGGTEVSRYLLSLMVMLVVAAALAVTKQTNMDIAAVVSVMTGMLALNILTRRDDERRTQAAHTAGVPVAADTSRHGWFGLHL